MIYEEASKYIVGIFLKVKNIYSYLDNNISLNIFSFKFISNIKYEINSTNILIKIYYKNYRYEFIYSKNNLKLFFISKYYNEQLYFCSKQMYKSNIKQNLIHYITMNDLDTVIYSKKMSISYVFFYINHKLKSKENYFFLNSFRYYYLYDKIYISCISLIPIYYGYRKKNIYKYSNYRFYILY